jgi:hypothetical protein
MRARPLKWRLAGGIAALALLSTVLVWQLSSALSRQQIESDQNTLLTHIAVRMASQLAHDMDTRARDRKSTRLNSSHRLTSRMPSSA